MADKSVEDAYEEGYKDGHDESNDDGIFMSIAKDMTGLIVPDSDENEAYEKGKADGQKDREKEK